MKVLVVEDDRKTAAYLRNGLGESGFAVDVARNGVDGWHLATTGDYDAIILDVMLPQQDGWSILTTLRSSGDQTPEMSAPAGAKNENAPPAQSVAPMAEQLAARLKKNPNDARGWHMLARSYGATGRFRESAEAYAKVAALVPNNPQLLADYAYILAIANGQNLNGKPTALLQSALKIDPAISDRWRSPAPLRSTTGNTRPRLSIGNACRRLFRLNRKTPARWPRALQKRTQRRRAWRSQRTIRSTVTLSADRVLAPCARMGARLR